MVLIVSLMSFQSPFLSVASPESAALEAVLRHRGLILEAIQQGTGLKGFTAEEEQLAESLKEVRWGESPLFQRILPGKPGDGLIPKGGTRFCGVPVAC